MRLDGKIALVTGARSGIGHAIAERFAAEGAVVVAADISSPPGDIGHVDVADAGSVAALLARIAAAHGRLDILAHSAGIGRNLPFLETPVAAFDQVIAVNLRGTFLVAQAAARLMACHGGGSIVALSSISGMRGNIGRAAYGASKGGITLLFQVMANELDPLGIRANLIAPGPIQTPLTGAMASADGLAPWLRAIPQGRMGLAEEVAAAAVFLASDEARYINGHVLAVDGGFLAAGVNDR